MRGRRARVLYLVPSDVPILQHIARSRSQPWFHVQHARILLAVCAGQRIQTIAVQMQCDPATVWRICRRYEQHGFAAILQDDERTGRPQRISPPFSTTKSSDWLAWNRSPKDCISPIGPVTTWLAKQ